MSLGFVTVGCGTCPAPEDNFPSWSNIWAVPPPVKAVGTPKLARFKALKNSARNCRLELSEIFLIGKFLNTEKSRFLSDGPSMLFRPALPSKFEQYTFPLGAACGAFGKEAPPPGGPHAAANEAGADGRVKQPVLM